MVVEKENSFCHAGVAPLFIPVFDHQSTPPMCQEMLRRNETADHALCGLVWHFYLLYFIHRLNELIYGTSPIDDKNEHANVCILVCK